MSSRSDRLRTSSESISQVIDKLHNMPWLKNNHSSSQNKKLSQDSGNNKEKNFCAKKTDEDYFSGTRKEKDKKMKKKKEKFVFNVDNLDDLVHISGRKILHSDSKLESERSQYSYVKKNTALKISFKPSAGGDTTSDTVWSADARVADVLFPNVQSVRIDRMEEEEMLSRALAESIASVQLEQFKRNSPKEENSWDTLYGDNDEDGWDNVQRNLPAETERPTSRIISGDTSSKKSNDSNNNSSMSGILRNKNECARRSILLSENLDFCFKKCSDTSDEETRKILSPKSVAFGDSVTIEIAYDKQSENDDESKRSNKVCKVPKGNGNGELVIDKFGRVNGYSERRLFMGKGARMKEQLYMQSRCSFNETEKYVQATAMTVNNNIQDAVKKAKKVESPLKSSMDKPASHRKSLDRNSTTIDSLSVENFVAETSESTKGAMKSGIQESRQIENEEKSLQLDLSGSDLETKKGEVNNSCDKDFEYREASEVEIISTTYETNNEPQSKDIANTNSSFIGPDVDEKIRSEKTIVENSGSVRDATELQTLRETSEDPEAYCSTVADKLSSENVHYANAVSAISETSPPHRTYRNLYVPELSRPDGYFGVENLTVDNINSGYHPNLINHEELQYYGNIPAHQSSLSYNYNPYSMPGYFNAPNQLQISSNDHPHVGNHIASQYSPGGNDVHSINSYCDASRCEEAGRNRSSPTIGFTESSLSAQFNTENETNRFIAVQSVPGLVGRPRLPPAFKKRNPVQRNCRDNYGGFVRPGATQRVVNSVSRNDDTSNNNSEQAMGNHSKKKFQTMSGHFVRKIQNGSHDRGSNGPKNRQKVDPRQRFHRGYKNHWEVDDINSKLKSVENSSNPHADRGNDRSPQMHDTVVNSMPVIPNSDYFDSSTHNQSAMVGFRNLDACSRSLQNTDYSTPYSTPVQYYFPDQYHPEPYGIPKWQFNMNATNLTQLQASLMPEYSTPIPDRFGCSDSSGIPVCPNYNPNNRTVVGHRFARNNLPQIDRRAVSNIFDGVKVGKGRGRLTKRDLI